MSGLDALVNPDFSLDSEEDFTRFFRGLTAAEQREIAEASKQMRRAGPIDGPQLRAYNSPAKVLGYGGGAGGGKSGLICILALLAHERTVCFRSDAKQMSGMIDDLVDFVGTSAGLNRQFGVFRFTDRPNHLFEWGGLGKPNAEAIWRGRPHDLLAADEVTEIEEHKLKFVKTWCRSATKGQRTRIVYTFNPPGRPDDQTGMVAGNGAWVREYFAPWVDPRHPEPAESGEIRYFYTDENGDDVPAANDDPVEVRLKGRVYQQVPEARTFIPALVEDNPYMPDSYRQTLLSLDEPLRSQMLLGDFTAGIEDSEWQVIPTAWVEEAMDRWEPDGQRDPMVSMGVDVARGGSAWTVLARRHGFWWDRLVRVPGRETPTGQAVVKLVVDHMRDGCEVVVDATAVGASPYDIMRSQGMRVIGAQGARRKGLARLEPTFQLYNLRSWLYWALRKVLDPSNRLAPALPRDKKLKAQLIAPRFGYQGGLLQVETKDDLRKRLGYSPDEADAVALSCQNVLAGSGAHRLTPTKPPLDLGLYRAARAYQEHGSGWMVA